MSELASEPGIEPTREAPAERQRGRAVSELASEPGIEPTREAPAERKRGRALSPFTVLPGCTACGACLPTCPERCLRPAPPGHAAPLVVLAERCTGCGECAEVCPAEAIRPLSEILDVPRPYEGLGHPRPLVSESEQR